MAYVGVNKAQDVKEDYLIGAKTMNSIAGTVANTALNIGQQLHQTKMMDDLEDLNNTAELKLTKAENDVYQNTPLEEREAKLTELYNQYYENNVTAYKTNDTVKKQFKKTLSARKVKTLSKWDTQHTQETISLSNAHNENSGNSLATSPNIVGFLKANGLIVEKGQATAKKEPSLADGFVTAKGSTFGAEADAPQDIVLSPKLQEMYENGASEFELAVAGFEYYAQKRHPNNKEAQADFVRTRTDILKETMPVNDLHTLFAANFNGKPPEQWDFNGFLDKYSTMLASSEYGGQKLSSYQKMELQKAATSLFEQYRAQESSRNNELFKQSAKPDLDKLIATDGKLTTEEYLARIKESGADPYFFPEEHARYLSYTHAIEQKDLVDQYVAYVTGNDFPGKADVIADFKTKIDSEYLSKAQTTINSIAKQMKEQQATDDASQLLVSMQQIYLHDIGAYDYEISSDEVPDGVELQEQAHQSVQETILNLKNRLGETEYNKVKWKFDNWKESLAPKSQTFSSTDDPWIKGSLDEMVSNASQYSNEEILSLLEQNKGHLTKETFEKLNDTKQLDKFRNPIFVDARETFQTDAKKLLGTSYYLLNKDGMLSQLAQECLINGTNPNMAAGNLLKKYQEEAAYKKVDGLFDVISEDKVQDFTGIFGQGNDMQQFAKDSANGITDAFITDAAKQFFSSFQSMGAEQTSKLTDDEVNTMIVGYFLGLEYTDGIDYSEKVKQEYAKAPNTVKNIIAKQSQYASLAMKSAQSYDTEVGSILGNRQGYFLTPYGPGIIGSEGMVSVPWVGDDGNRTWAVFGTKTVDGKQEMDPDKRMIVSKQDLSTLELESNIEKSVENFFGTMKSYGGHQTRGGMQNMFKNPSSLPFLKDLEKREELYNATVNSLGKQKYILAGGDPDKYKPVRYKVVFNVDEYQKTSDFGDLVRLAKVTQ